MGKDFVELYGLEWAPNTPEIAREMTMIQHGGRWKLKNGKMVGKGMLFHFIRFQELLWPEKLWHKWNRLETECYLKYRTIVEIGPASSGKTNSAATNGLADWFCFPERTTGLYCSTTRERLEDRIWGEVKKFFRMAKSRCQFIPGQLIEGRQRIVLDPRTESIEGRDFRNGLIGVPCKKGGEYVGLGDFIGIKNKRVRLFGDELHLLPKVFVESISNLDKNPDLKVVGLGNPKETTDALGVLAEPAAYLGGWEGGIDQTPGTKTWEIRRPGGVCIQLPGSDSPNLKGDLGIPLITQEQIDRDVAFYGKDSLWFTMFNEGRMPRGQGSRRVLTRQMCLRFHAMEEARWRDSNRTKVAFLDAAYRGVGGDRCIYGELEFGDEAQPVSPEQVLTNLIAQNSSPVKRRQIMSLTMMTVVPINVSSGELPEDQIVNFVRNQCMGHNIPPSHFFFDSGMRTSLVTAFARIWSNEVNSVDCGGRPSERPVSADIQVKCCDYYSKFITEKWFDVRMIVEAEQFRQMTDEVIMEFASREWKMVGANKIEVETKEEMKKKTGRSPDLADALVMGVHGAIKLGFVIAKMIPLRGHRHGPDWRTEAKQKSRDFWHKADLTYK